MSDVWPCLGLRLRSWTCPVQGPDMSEKRFCNPAMDLDKSGKRLSRCEEGVNWTCPVQEPDMSGKVSWNLATDPDKSGGLMNLEGVKHVRFCLLESG
jgi:hypothetical protein